MGHPSPPSAHHNHHPPRHDDARDSVARLATSATVHCLVGCGIGEVAGMTVGMALHFTNLQTTFLAIIAGIVFGFALGIWPLKRAGYAWSAAIRQVLIAEGLSIAVMETAEVLVQVYTPGVMEAGFSDSIYWIGMGIALIAGFAAAYPVNYVMVKRGVRHLH